MTGDAWPTPTVACHFFVNCAGHVAGAVNPDATPSRAGPRHWDQSAKSAALNVRTTRTTGIVRIVNTRGNPYSDLSASTTGVRDVSRIASSDASAPVTSTATSNPPRLASG